MSARINSTEPMAQFEVSIPQDQIDCFFPAVAWQTPGRPMTPPTLATVFREGEFQALQKLAIPLQKVLHGEQKYRFKKDLRAGVKYDCTTHLNSHFEKTTGTG